MPKALEVKPSGPPPQDPYTQLFLPLIVARLGLGFCCCCCCSIYRKNITKCKRSMTQLLIFNTALQNLKALKEAPLLHTLKLDLPFNSIGNSGTQALAALKEAPLLHTLELDLPSNLVQDSGAEAFAALKELAPPLAYSNP